MRLTKGAPSLTAQRGSEEVGLDRGPYELVVVEHTAQVHNVIRNGLERNE